MANNPQGLLWQNWAVLFTVVTISSQCHSRKGHTRSMSWVLSIKYINNLLQVWLQTMLEHITIVSELPCHSIPLSSFMGRWDGSVGKTIGSVNMGSNWYHLWQNPNMTTCACVLSNERQMSSQPSFNSDEKLCLYITRWMTEEDIQHPVLASPHMHPDVHTCILFLLSYISLPRTHTHTPI